MHPDDRSRLLLAFLLLGETLVPIAGANSAARARAPAHPGGEEAPVIEEDTEEAGRAAAIYLSDGSVLRGQLSLTPGRRLRIHDLQSRRAHALDLEQITAIRTFVETEGLQEAWAFEEEGSRRKIALGWTYPLRSYLQEVQLEGGQVLRGHSQAAVLYLDDGHREHKLILPRQQKGERGQKLDDLVYPRTILLGVQPPGRERSAVPLADVKGKVPSLAALVAVEVRTGMGYPAQVERDGTFHLEGLLPGKYAVLFRQGEEVVFGLPEESSLSAEERGAVAGRIAAIDEFFEEKRVVFAGGEPERAWALVELRRLGKTTLPAPGGPARVRRWEVWSLSRRGSEWQVTIRIFIDRRLLEGAGAFPETRYRRDPRLWQLELEAGENRLSLGEVR